MVNAQRQNLQHGRSQLQLLPGAKLFDSWKLRCGHGPAADWAIRLQHVCTCCAQTARPFDKQTCCRNLRVRTVQGYYAVTQRQGFCQGVRHLVLQAQQSPGDQRLHSKYLQVMALLNLRCVDPAR